MRHAVIRAATAAGPECSGSRCLSIFARVLNAQILRAHAEGPQSSSELATGLGWAARASLRLAASNLCEVGALEPAGRRAETTVLTAAGRDLLSVANALEHWLSLSPFGPLELPSEAARGTVRALVAGWDSTIVRALAERPRRLADLSPEISGYSYPALKRRFAKLRTAALIERVDGRARSPEFAAMLWLRRAVGVLMLAARWERSHLPGAVSLGKGELEAALLLALPLVDLPAGASGSFVLAAPLANGSGDRAEPALAAISLVVKKAKVASLTPSAMPAPGTWVLGSTDTWLDALAEGRRDDLRISGTDAELAGLVVDRVSGTPF